LNQLNLLPDLLFISGKLSTAPRLRATDPGENYSYASLLGPPNQGSDHSNCTFHSHTCTASNVKATAEYVLFYHLQLAFSRATNVNSNRYVRKHVSDNCKCGYVNIPTGDDSELAAAISRGDIPVIHIQEDGIDVKVDVQSYSKANPIPYTALSHV